MQQGRDFDFSFSPTVSSPAIKIVIAFAAAYNLILAILDVVNCFQNTMIPIEKCLYITLSPYYLEWFTETWPEVQLEPDENNQYVVQTLNGIQGQKEVGRSW